MTNKTTSANLGSKNDNHKTTKLIIKPCYLEELPVLSIFQRRLLRLHHS